MIGKSDCKLNIDYSLGSRFSQSVKTIRLDLKRSSQIIKLIFTIPIDKKTLLKNDRSDAVSAGWQKQFIAG